MVVSVKRLSYRYPYSEKRAVDHVSFDVRRGETVMLTGNSGSGKSTVGGLLSGVIPQLYKDGQLSGEISFAEDGGRQVGLVTQIPDNQLFGYRVEDAVVFGMENLGLSREEIDSRLNRVLDLFRIGHLRERAVSSLSGGQKQIVCIASVLCMEPDLLIMDEPVSSLDPAGKELVREVLKRLKAQGQTVLLIDQNLDWPAGAVDRVIGIDEGRIAFDGSTEAFLRNEALYLRLGVTVPQAVELYHHARLRGDFPLFLGLEEAERVLSGMELIVPEPPLRPAEKEAEPALAIEGLVKDYEGFRALKGVNTRFMPGRITAVLGQNGSGKTTLVRHLIRLVKPTSGTIRYRGRSIGDKSPAEMARSVAYVFQHPDQMIFEDSVWKEVTFSVRSMELPWREEQVTELLRAHGLLEFKEAFPNNLSMGRKHMLTILSVLLSDPDVVILDEPTLGMDRGLKAMLADLMKRLAGEGKTLIVISHEMTFVAETADDAIVMKDGNVLVQGPVADVFRREDLLDQARIKLPEITRLGNRLGVPDILSIPGFLDCLTGNEAARKGGDGGEV
ncbi:ABC transporter ATP-binding protein [Cohnella caldifontis]|uniref:ABC transporter ATP-binding protein n=1 Tax=Cohnella caldifontis TaxID=3027471 RepID=UPI0023EE00FA|nr:ATP-binding cassette domain-containing protein [Cohnella sp. YIM B05605]